jgi:hypothetical protein
VLHTKAMHPMNDILMGVQKVEDKEAEVLGGASSDKTLSYFTIMYQMTWCCIQTLLVTRPVGGGGQGGRGAWGGVN